MGHILALEKGRTGESYLLGGENYTHRDVVTRVLALAGVKRKVWEVNPSLLMPMAMVMKFVAGFTKVSSKDSNVNQRDLVVAI